MTVEPSIWDRREVEVTGSTNTDLLRAAEAGEVADRTVLRAEHQTAGRGRLDRRWDAPPGANLLASMYVEAAATQAVELMHRVGLAIVDATIDIGAAGSLIGLKWPNDVLADGRKLAGVLAQRSTSAPGIVVGFGVNVGWAPPEAARLDDIAQIHIEPAVLLDRILVAFDSLPGDVSSRYRSALLTIGQRVRVELPGGSEVVGVALDVEDSGRLQVRTDAGPVRTFDVGDVVHLRRAN